MSDEAMVCGHPRSVGMWRGGGCRACHGVPFAEAYGRAATPAQSADVAVVAAAIERSRWIEAMEDVADDMERRENACDDTAGGHAAMHDVEAMTRASFKANAYGHAAQMLRDAIRLAKEAP